jgi:hypothetical protein
MGCSAAWGGGAMLLPRGALELGLSERVVRLFTIEATSDQTLGNWYHFIKAIHRIKDLLTVKDFILLLLPSLVGCANRYSEENF